MHSDQMCGRTKNIEGLDDVFDVFSLTKHPRLALNFWSVIVLSSERDIRVEMTRLIEEMEIV